MNQFKSPLIPKSNMCRTFMMTMFGALAFGAAVIAMPDDKSPSPVPEIDARTIQDAMLAEAIDALRAESEEFVETGDVIPFTKARIFFETNATDGDMGLHFLVDGEPWKRVMILDPTFHRFVTVRAQGSEAENGITELCSESAEPGFDKVPPGEFLELFPAGFYLIVGVGVEGEFMASFAKLTHDLPAQPKPIYPADGDEVPFDEPLVIEWHPVPDPDGSDSEITGYLLEVSWIGEDEGLPDRQFTVEVTVDQTSVTVPPEFLVPDHDYKYEILAAETSGNKTITEVEFSTSR